MKTNKCKNPKYNKCNWIRRINCFKIDWIWRMIFLFRWKKIRTLSKCDGNVLWTKSIQNKNKRWSVDTSSPICITRRCYYAYFPSKMQRNKKIIEKRTSKYIYENVHITYLSKIWEDKNTKSFFKLIKLYFCIRIL